MAIRAPDGANDGESAKLFWNFFPKRAKNDVFVSNKVKNLNI